MDISDVFDPWLEPGLSDCRDAFRQLAQQPIENRDIVRCEIVDNSDIAADRPQVRTNRGEMSQFAQLAGVYQVFEDLQAWAEQKCVACHQHALDMFGQGDELARLVGLCAQRLLAQHVFPGTKCRRDDFGVRDSRGRNHDCVNSRIIEDSGQIQLPAHFREVLGDPVKPLRIVIDGGQFHSRDRLAGWQCDPSMVRRNREFADA
ncbi:MAG TPA: hypothetical protein VEI07_10655 [Planctomycetaceae bacterium]|nr:hypothetical protein [Planctomycetaceae bacterium]